LASCSLFLGQGPSIYQLDAAGADLVVVIGAVVAAPDVREAARRLAERISERRQRTARG
jgi:thiamine monophosphate synthase